MQQSQLPGHPEDGRRKDKNYRRYASNVERALSLFDNALQEWADYISFLGRLLRALQSKPSDTTDIPHNSIVAKRLAQCLNPMLGSGVHQKTLEVYAYVFNILGKNGLSKDLPLWLPGLSPTLSFASLSVKPTLLSLFERFIVTLNASILRSALKAIIIALLPGLEEEASEDFERTLLLLGKFRKAISQDLKKTAALEDAAGDQYFWQSLFLTSITSASRRQGVLVYLARELPCLGGGPRDPELPEAAQSVAKRGLKGNLSPEIEAVTSPDPGILIRCFAAGLKDDQNLVQRGFLDLLVSHLPLDSAFFRQKVLPKDLELLVLAAASVVTRREMSLNRRLWSWFLGPERSMVHDNGNLISSTLTDSSIATTYKDQDLPQLAYFERYGLEPLVHGILEIFENDGVSPLEKCRPFRICSSLMDRSEIGGLIVPRVFLPAMESVLLYQEIAPSKDALAEVLRSANVFFDGIESTLIWAKLIQILTQAMATKASQTSPQDRSPESLLDLVSFVITNFNIREEEMLTLHIPMATLVLLISIRYGLVSLQKPAEEAIASFMLGFRISSRLVEVIPQGIFASERFSNGALPSESLQMLSSIKQYYEKLLDGPDDIGSPLEINTIGEAMIHNASRIVTTVLKSNSICLKILEPATGLLERILLKTAGLNENEYEHLMSGILEASERLTPHYVPSPFVVISALIAVLEVLEKLSGAGLWESDRRTRQILPMLLEDLWWYTSPSRPKHNVEAIRCLWRIHQISPDKHLVEGSIANFLLKDQSGQRSRIVDIESARRFAVLWTHSNSTSPTISDHRLTLGHVMQNTSEKTLDDHGDPSMLTRPLLLLLDSLSDQTSELFMFVTSWLRSLSSIQRVVNTLIYHLHATLLVERVISGNEHLGQKILKDVNHTPTNIEDCLYYLQTVLNLVQFSSSNARAPLASTVEIESHPRAADQLEETKPSSTVRDYLIGVCRGILRFRCNDEENVFENVSHLYQTSVLLLHQLFLYKSLGIPMDVTLEKDLIETLSWSVETGNTMLQASIMELVLVSLQAQSLQPDAAPNASNLQRKPTSQEVNRNTSQVSLSADTSGKNHASLGVPTLIPGLLDCVILGISSPKSHTLLEQWIRFMEGCLPYYSGNIFQTIMPLVDCFIGTIESILQGLQVSFESSTSDITCQSEHIGIINLLLNGLEQMLARGHDRLLQDEGQAALTRSPEQTQGFFGNMVSGVFTPEAQRSKSAAANNRLTILLCFKDVVRISFRLWSWGDIGQGTAMRDATTSASFNYTSLRLRNRTRRFLEHLFAVEMLECLETLVEIGHRSAIASVTSDMNIVLNLIHALEGSRPKNTIPALFNAMYSRANPNVLDPVRKSSLASELSDSSLATFLVAYTKSMEDDALDEIWSDCLTFLRDVLGNPLPHRQTLPTLLDFTAILGEKIDNTNFGEQRKMRREIGDVFARLLAATFTIKPLAFPQELPSMANGDHSTPETLERLDVRKSGDINDAVVIVARILPSIVKILVDTDRVVAATTTISNQILMPTFRSKTFPYNVTESTVAILKAMSRIPECAKTWRKDVADAFNDPRFFHVNSLDLVRNGWMPVLRQWILLDKDRMPDLLSRLSSPTSAGIMFGVGASSARLEADRKAQLNLRRIALLILSSDADTFIINLGSLLEKLMDLMTATVASSPSSSTRAEVYMVFRSLILTITPVHLASFWPIISTELYEALSSLRFVDHNDRIAVTNVLHAVKLLDILLIIAPDDFQLREWLFITDTIDAVYRPPDWYPIALADGLGEDPNAKAGVSHHTSSATLDAHRGRRPLLTWKTTSTLPPERLIDRVLRPFFRQLSIVTFEKTYQMESVDLQACLDDLLHDLCDETAWV